MLSEYQLIFLAAGNSSRTSVPKGLILKSGLPWIVKQQEMLLDLFLGGYTILLGKHASAYSSLIDEAFKKVENPNPDLGPFSSIVKGIESLKKNTQGVFVLPLDVPCPEKKVWETLAESLKKSDAVVPLFNGRGGHPVLLSESFAKKLLSIPLDSENARLDFQLHELPEGSVQRVEVGDSKVVMNLNTDTDFKTCVF